MKIYASITKLDPVQRMVFGYASTEALDSQNEVVSKDAIKNALADYMKFANVREMHQPSAVGTTKEASVDEKGLYIAVKVVDNDAWEKVKEGVYKGFSIGGKSTEKIDGTITGLRLTEISLVDRPANPDCLIEVWKMDDAPEPTVRLGDMLRAKLVLAPEPVPTAMPVPMPIERKVANLRLYGVTHDIGAMSDEDLNLACASNPIGFATTRHDLVARQLAKVALVELARRRKPVENWNPPR